MFRFEVMITDGQPKILAQFGIIKVKRDASVEFNMQFG